MHFHKTILLEDNENVFGISYHRRAQNNNNFIILMILYWRGPFNDGCNRTDFWNRHNQGWREKGPALKRRGDSIQQPKMPCVLMHFDWNKYEDIFLKGYPVGSMESLDGFPRYLEVCSRNIDSKRSITFLRTSFNHCVLGLWQLPFRIALYRLAGPPKVRQRNNSGRVAVVYATRRITQN